MPALCNIVTHSNCLCSCIGCQITVTQVRDSSSSQAATVNRYQHEIHVVWCASDLPTGHMYERLQKIMILSVIKNTKSKVKFWLISNYMSPHHKQVMLLCVCLG